MTAGRTPLVGILVGSRADLAVMERASTELERFDVPHALDVLAAERDLASVSAWATAASGSGLRVVIVGASGSGHLAGLVAAHTDLPVIGVPCPSGAIGAAEALVAVAHVPPGLPVATVGPDAAGDAALLAVRILALGDADLAARLAAWRTEPATSGTEHREVRTGRAVEGFGFGPSGA